MIGTLTIVLQLLHLCYCDNPLSFLEEGDNLYHAAKTEIKLAGFLGPEGIAILMIVGAAELFLLIAFSCCWCCKCCCCSYLNNRSPLATQVGFLPQQQQIGMVPTGVVYPTPSPPYLPTHYAESVPPYCTSTDIDVPLLDNME